jgi:hypothetical protein
VSRRRPAPSEGSFYRNFRGVARPIQRKRPERPRGWIDVTCDSCSRRIGAVSCEKPAPITQDDLIIEGQAFARSYAEVNDGLETTCAHCERAAVIDAAGAVVALNGLIEYGQHAVRLSVAQVRALAL